ncbi:MAG TPA: PDZ domain-containing protein, partial [Proteobacteria bacterium]|nr:PDZ domain-containing protein [Pseudomonadota bacterium]
NELRNIVAATAPGTKVDVRVIHEGKQITRTVIIGELPEKFGAERREIEPERGGESEENFFGMYLGNLTPDVRQRFGIDKGVRGVVIIEVDPSGEAAQKGLRPGDVIVEVNHKKVNDLDEFRAAIEEGKGKPYLMLIDHGGGETSYVVLGTNR